MVCGYFEMFFADWRAWISKAVNFFWTCNSVEQFHCTNTEFIEYGTAVVRGLQLFNRIVYFYLEYSWMKNQQISEN